MKKIMKMVKKSLIKFKNRRVMVPKKKLGSAVNRRNLNILNTRIIRITLKNPMLGVMSNRGSTSRERVGTMAIKSTML